jgi:hypothetical protein
MPIKVKKRNGELEDFNEQKVRLSLQRVGAKPDVIDKILVSLSGKLTSGMTTQLIYKHVFDLLNQLQAGQSYRYSLKNSLLGLGPSGYPFEKFISQVLKAHGYQTKIQQIVQGKCITHEIDVSATLDKEKYLVECKFHNRHGTKTRSKDALYTYARFLDLSTDFTKVWLITNTKITQNAIQYGLCQGIKLTAWNYPQKGSLQELIESKNLHPLTCLSFLDSRDLQLFFQNDLVLCRDLVDLKEKQLQEIGLNSSKLKRVKTAISQLHY